TRARGIFFTTPVGSGCCGEKWIVARRRIPGLEPFLQQPFRASLFDPVTRSYIRDMDEDLADLDRDALIEQVRRLRAGIREHRDSFGHELCWHHPRLWGLLPEKTDPQPSVPAWPQFLRGCIQYRESLDRQLPATPRTSDEFEGR